MEIYLFLGFGLALKKELLQLKHEKCKEEEKVFGVTQKMVRMV